MTQPGSWSAFGRGVNLGRSEIETMRSSGNVIVRDPEVLGGTPVFTGTRVPFQALLDYLEGGQSLNDFLDDFPSVTREAAIHVLEHAKTLVVSELE